MERDLTDNASLRNLKQPVALFFSYVDVERYDFYKSHKEELIDIQNFHRDDLIKFLQDRNYPVVSNINPLAAHPASIVVSSRGIQTPFLQPEDARDVAQRIIRHINNSGFVKPMSYVMGVRLEQLSPPILHEQETPSVFSYTKHPDGRMLQYINYRYGPHFLERMYRLARQNAEDTEPLLKQKFDVFNLDEDLYSGRQLILEPHTIHARSDMESRYLVYATLSYANAARYAKDKSFIHHFGKGENQEYYNDYGIEMGAMPETNPLNQIETVVLPDINEYRGVELFMKDCRFQIPTEEEMWQVFSEYFRAAYQPMTEYMRERRINILQEAKHNNQTAVTYMPVGYRAESLTLEKYKQRDKPELEDVLLTAPTQIRKDFVAFNFEKLCQKARQILEQTQKNTTPEPQSSISTKSNHKSTQR